MKLLKQPQHAIASNSMKISGEGVEGTFSLVDEVTGRWPESDEKAKSFL